MKTIQAFPLSWPDGWVHPGYDAGLVLAGHLALVGLENLENESLKCPCPVVRTAESSCLHWRSTTGPRALL